MPAAFRRDVLVTVDGAGASHGAHRAPGCAEHRCGARCPGPARGVLHRVATRCRTRGAIEELGEGDWSAVLAATGDPDEGAGVVELTGLLRHSIGRDQMATWLAAARVIGRRVPRAPGEQAKLGED